MDTHPGGGATFFEVQRLLGGDRVYIADLPIAAVGVSGYDRPFRNVFVESLFDSTERTSPDE